MLRDLPYCLVIENRRHCAAFSNRQSVTDERGVAMCRCLGKYSLARSPIKIGQPQVKKYTFTALAFPASYSSRTTSLTMRLDGTLGSLLIGHTVSAILFGITSIQTWIYFRKPKDALLMRFCSYGSSTVSRRPL
ncbi:hypothetical protein OBBRIDRAFT_791802 [Obba rivulosa]|uniref:Uncharacterized protein n=1 Tax=Obba rivulosa TaxID=1052685 RepID=A0A8E2B1G5_9APHY|nr:hypothetical protein OBBRIDRAFT_791802 [Obba rivulosa]